MIVLNIETIPDPELPEALLPEHPKREDFKAPRTWKDPAKISEYIDKAIQERMQEIEKEKSEMGLSPLTGQIICVGYQIDNEDPILIVNEADCLESLSVLLVKAEDEGFITYNGKNFDLPFIRIELLRHKFPVSPFYSKFIKRYDANYHIDMYELMSNFYQNKKGKLSDWAIRLGLTPIYGKGEQVLQWWQEGKWEEIKKHCESNVRTTYELYRRWFGVS